MGGGSSPTNLVPAYVDREPTVEMSVADAGRRLADIGLRIPEPWSVVSAATTFSIVSFARRADVPLYVGAAAPLARADGPSPPIAAEERIPLLDAVVANGHDGFELQVSPIQTALARVWRDSLLDRLELNGNPLG